MSFQMHIPTRILFGAGLIMISKEYYQYFVNQHACDQRFIAMGKTNANKPQDFVDALVELQAACEVDHLKMSDYGMLFDEMDNFAKNARKQWVVYSMQIL